MDDSVNYNNNESSISLEAENCLETEDLNASSAKYSENLEDPTQDQNKSYRRSGRTRNKSFRFNSDEVYYSTSSPSNLEYNNASSEEVYKPEPSTSSHKNIALTKNSMSKRKRTNLTDLLGQILSEIGLYDELYEFMKSRGITAEALKYMQARHIDELFRGTRLSTKIVFEHNLKEWQTKNGIFDVNNARINTQLNTALNDRLTEAEISLLSNLLTNAVQETINKVLQEFKAPSQQCQQFNNNMQFHDEIPIDEVTLSNIKTEPNFFSEDNFTPDKSYKKIDKKSNKLQVNNSTNEEILIPNQLYEQSEPQAKRRKGDYQISVQEILNSVQFGQRLIDEYQKTGVFSSYQRTELVRTVVEFYMRQNQVISTSRCKQIAEEIVELFPTESMEVYFNQEVKSKPPKGKIWDRYQARRRALRKLNGSAKAIIKTEMALNANDSHSKVDWSDMEAMCSELKHIHDEKLLLEKWKDSFTFRRHQLQMGWFANWKLYFDEYPFCKQQNYAKFIESDLDTLYPNLKFNDFLWDEFIKHFPTFFSNRIKHPQSKQLFEQLIADNNLDNSCDYVAIKVIELLHAVLKTYGKQLQTIDDGQRQFTVEVTDLSDLKKVVIERKKQCTDNNIQAKPYIAVVGHDKTYSHFSVILDSTGFSCDNYKDSLILCFNLYLFFEMSFPYESLNVWTFIQQYFFNKPTLVSNPRVESFINDIKAQKHMLYDDNTMINGTK